MVKEERREAQSPKGVRGEGRDDAQSTPLSPVNKDERLDRRRVSLPLFPYGSGMLRRVVLPFRHPIVVDCGTTRRVLSATF